MRKKTLGFGFFVLIFLFLAIGFIFVQWVQLGKAEKEIKTLKASLATSESQTAEGAAVDAFLEGFFTYNSTGERYEHVKPLMTAAGYRATYPSGMEMPKTVFIKSELVDSRNYQDKPEQDRVHFYSEITYTTDINKTLTTQKSLIKTSMELVNGAWLVNSFEFITSLGSDKP